MIVFLKLKGKKKFIAHFDERLLLLLILLCFS